jgi:hypothetical protein
MTHEFTDIVLLAVILGAIAVALIVITFTIADWVRRCVR